jgi:radical SAM protein with 4Fe4S-binding SPASM domain
MSVRNCAYPWHWLIINNDGNVMPCGHGSLPVGNLRESSTDEIWNGGTLRDVRAHILRGVIHSVCRSGDCPYQRRDAVFPENEQRIDIIGVPRDEDERA